MAVRVDERLADWSKGDRLGFAQLIRTCLLVVATAFAAGESVGQPVLVTGYPLVDSEGYGASTAKFVQLGSGNSYSILGLRGIAGAGATILDLAGIQLSSTFVDSDVGILPSFSLSRACVGDVDGDGAPELVYTRTNGNDLWVYGQSGAFVSPVWPQGLDVTCNNGIRSYALVNLDSDPELEILAPAEGSCSGTAGPFTIAAVNSDGSSVPGFPIALPPNHLPVAVAVGDLEFDGTPEIAVASVWADSLSGLILPTSVCVYEHDGTMRTGWPQQPLQTALESGYFADIAIGDLDADGRCEVVGVGPYRATVYSDGGVELGAWGGLFGETIALADLDGDATLEIVVVGTSIYVFDLALGQTASRALSEDLEAISIADDDGDGIATIGTYGQQGDVRIRLLDPQLVDRAGSPITHVPTFGDADETRYPQFIDHDGDGDLELAYNRVEYGIHLYELPGEGTGVLHWDGFGGNTRGTKYAHEFHKIENFVRGDANHDGTVELLDVIVLLDYALSGSGGAPDCLRALDASASDSISLIDAIAILNQLFVASGVTLPYPYPSCGVDTASTLACDVGGACP